MVVRYNLAESNQYTYQNIAKARESRPALYYPEGDIS